jgi:ribose transport system permease protein
MKDISGTALLGPLAAMVIVALLVALTTPRFLEAGNLSNLVLQVSIVALVAIGSTLVIFSGGIDLSPGSAIALLSMVFAVMVKLVGIDFWLALIATLALGALLGSVNGFVTAYLRIPSFITTLAALSAFKGLAFLFNNGSPVFQVSPLLEPIFYGHVLGLPLPLVYVILAFGAAHWLMRYARLGRCIYAVGGNPRAAHLSGIDVRRTQFLAFTIAGLMAAAGAILMAARLNSGSPNYGAGLELQAIAAAVIGGASLAGGRGHVLATLLGALTITIVQNGLNLNGVPSPLQSIIVGVIIVIAVGIDMWRTELGRAFSRLLPAKASTPIHKEGAR